MSVTNPSAIIMSVPQYKVDNIIGIHTGSFFIAAPTAAFGGSPTSASDGFSTGFGDTCLFQGIFSVDGGATWNDFGSMKPNFSTPGQPVLQTVTCTGGINPDGTFYAMGQNYYDIVHSSGTAYTIQYKVVFFARDDQGPITPLTTNQILQYDSRYNFQKIYQSGYFASGAATTINHNLNYVPKVRAWYVSPSASSPLVANALHSYDSLGSGGYNINISTTQATFDAVSGISKTYYRIYLDS